MFSSIGHTISARKQICRCQAGNVFACDASSADHEATHYAQLTQDVDAADSMMNMILTTTGMCDDDSQ